jgi:hypothetical protein
MDDELKQHLEVMEGRMNARIEKVGTALLTEFHKWASPAEMRAKSHALAIRAMDLELEARTGI